MSPIYSRIMMVPPPEVKAAWPAPNYDHPETRGSESFVVCCCFMAIVLAVVPLRFYTRLRISKNFGADDLLLGVGVIFALALNVLVSYAYFARIWGAHVWDVRPSSIPLLMQLTMAAQVLYVVASTSIKLSFLVFYQRLLDHYVWKYYRVVLIAIKSLVVAVALFYVPLIIFQCLPIRAYWEEAPTYSYYCLPLDFPNLSFTIISTILNFIIVLLPIPMVCRLRVPLRVRIGVCCLFGVGLLICIAGSFRSYYLWYVMYGTYDRNWYGMRIYIATVVEICVGIICASVPSLRPLFVKLWPRFRRTTKRLLPGSTKNLSSDASSQRSRQHSHAFSFEPASKKRPSQTVFDLDFTEEEMAADGSERSIEKVVEDSSSGGTPSPTKEPKFITSAV